MYRPTPSSTSTLPYSNGHVSPVDFTGNAAITPGSESDLSEATDPHTITNSSPHPSRQDDGGVNFDQNTNTESLHEEDAVGSDDADYNLETPPLADLGSPRDARSSSQDSQRNGKRKAGAEHDDFMLNNPELYGLRRSVGKSLNCMLCPAKQHVQGRAHPSRRIVSSPTYLLPVTLTHWLSSD